MSNSLACFGLCLQTKPETETPGDDTQSIAWFPHTGEVRHNGASLTTVATQREDDNNLGMRFDPDTGTVELFAESGGGMVSVYAISLANLIGLELVPCVGMDGTAWQTVNFTFNTTAGFIRSNLGSDVAMDIACGDPFIGATSPQFAIKDDGLSVYGYTDGQPVDISGGLFGDAPSDGTPYGRQDAAWVGLGSLYAPLADYNAHVADSSIHFTEASIDHGAIQNVGTNSHATIDVHLSSSTIHYSVGSISHTLIQDIGVNTHAQIDTHLADTTVHFTEASIDHTAIQNVGTNNHAMIDAHLADGTIHNAQANIDHTAIQNIGTNTHAQIDTHIADGTVHFTEASIDHTAIQNVGTNSHATIDSHLADLGIHFGVGAISHTAIQNIGTNTHAQIDAHISDGTVHFTEGSITHNNIGGRSAADAHPMSAVTGLSNFKNSFDSHVSDPSNVHPATAIGPVGPFSNFSGTDVGAALSSIDSNWPALVATADSFDSGAISIAAGGSYAPATAPKNNGTYTAIIDFEDDDHEYELRFMFHLFDTKFLPLGPALTSIDGGFGGGGESRSEIWDTGQVDKWRIDGDIGSNWDMEFAPNTNTITITDWGTGGPNEVITRFQYKGFYYA